LVPQCVGIGTGTSTMPHGPPHVSNTAPPVTLQQLQLVAHSLDPDSVQRTLSGVLLMSLLLQRADAGVRAQFLGSPWGSYFLDVLVTVAVPGQAPGSDASLLMTVPCDDPGVALAEFKKDLQWLGGEGWGQLPEATTSLLALAWAHLQVKEGSELQDEPMLGPQQWAVLASGWRPRETYATAPHGAGLPGEQCTQPTTKNLRCQVIQRDPNPSKCLEA
jgi:hypothetical protein